ncbi:MAG: valine--tRNA ligase, partial [Phototrophicales bacterium]
TLNRWIIGRVLECQKAIDKALENYRFNDAANTIYQFVWGTFCDWYLEFTKPLINGDDEAVKAEVQVTTGWVLEQILRLLNPFMPFITEELYASIAKRAEDDLLLGSAWPVYDATLKDEGADKQISWLMSVISEIRSVRADMNVPAKAQIDLMVKDADEDSKARLVRFEPMIKAMARVNGVTYTDEAPKGSIQTVVEPVTLVLPIADI